MYRRFRIWRCKPRTQRLLAHDGLTRRLGYCRQSKAFGRLSWLKTFFFHTCHPTLWCSSHLDTPSSKGGHALHVPWQRRSRPLRLIAPRPPVIMPILSCNLLLRQYLPLSDFGGGLILSSRRSLNLMLGTAEVFCRGLSGQMFRVSLCNIASYKRREFFEI